MEHGGWFLLQSPPGCRWRKRGAQIQSIGRSCGGLSTKIHALVDSLGNPLYIYLTGGNIHDITAAPKLIEQAKGEHFIADKGYNSVEIITKLKEKKITPVIPTKSNSLQPREIDRHIYKERHLVENFFCKIKRYRRVATRYEKTATNFLGFILFASIRVWLA